MFYLIVIIFRIFLDLDNQIDYYNFGIFDNVASRMDPFASKSILIQVNTTQIQKINLCFSERRGT